MADAIRENGLMVGRLWGPLSQLGLVLALLVFAVDQLTKWWILRVVNLDERPPIQLTPFADLLMAWNTGVSYGLLDTRMQGVLVALSVVISILLLLWLAKAETALAAASLALIIGGAMGNALDRLLHGAVADFVHLHWGTWSWYVFNVADIAIVAGVMVLVYDGFRPKAVA
jgi:signal peptidase II